MSPDERSRRALALFDELVELEGAARDTALSQLDDEALRKEVSALLEADAREGPLERPLLSLLSDDDEALPGRIGPWRITGVAGRGGMGAVYLGERDDGQFQQRAAIKLIRVGMDTPELRARFLRERQILAALKHPNIATLLDGGVTETGAPYFAMELVEGRPIDQWCDERRATLRERVTLFVQICAAVQHAHQNLVVHRDLKPANILIDADGRARLLDFGIARLLADDANGVFTHERPYTPDYAAPEQMHGGTITTATDVYGLGVVLHRLLCGPGPRHSGGEVEPLSRAALRASGEELRTRRLSSSRALASVVGGDLSAIVRRCLMPEATQRYGSVSALANDLRAWLAGAPVTARNPTRGYLLSRFISRNRWGVAAASVVVLAVAAGVTGVLWQARRAEEAATEARAQLDYLSSLLQVLAPSTADARELNRSRLIAEAARRARSELAGRPASLAGVELALAKVAQNVGDYAQATSLADSAHTQRVTLFGNDTLATAEALMLTGILRTQVSPPQFDEALRRLDEAITTIRRRAPASALLAQALQQRASVLGERDKNAEQMEALTEAAALCHGPLAAEAVCEDVWFEQGSTHSRNRRPELALPLLRRAWEARRKRLGADHASTLQLAGVLAWAQAESGDVQGGLALAEEVHVANQRIYTQPNETSLRALLRLSRLLKRSGNYARAVELVDEYLVHSRRLFGDENPNTVLGYSDRASLLFGTGRYEDAAAQFEAVARAYDAAGSDTNAALARGYVADSLREAGRAADALPVQQTAITSLRRLYPKGEHVMLAVALTNLALTERTLGQLEEALAHHDESLAMFGRLQTGTTLNASHARAMRGKTLFMLGSKQEAETELRAALGEMKAARENSPNLYWEAFGLLAQLACHNDASDCEELRAQAREAQRLSLAAATQRALREASHH